MEINKFQKKCAEIVKKIDKKHNIRRDSYLSFTQFVEETGELAKDINSLKLRGKEIDKKNLKGEFADVILQLAALAEICGVDFEEAVDYKIKILKERHNL